MLTSKLKKRNEGFTIIEVLIVLAIAGLIMLIVFLAVPALQRNSRNTQRDSDAARVGTAVNSWVSNNNGRAYDGTVAANETAIINDVGSLGQYTLTAATLESATGAQTGAVAIANLQVVTSAVCGDNGVTTAPAGANPRQMAIRYSVEGGGGNVPKCINI